MSSPSNQPYKSRLLNVINRYYIKLNSQVNVKFRELGYVLQGGFQKIIFPFFWLWQSTTTIVSVFSAAPVSDSSLPSADKDIISVENHPCNNLIEAVNHNLSLHPLFSSLLPDNFQGLATRVEDQFIVVIVHKNKMRNIIPKIKQEDLKFVINRTVDNFQSENKLTAKSVSKNIRKIFSFRNLFSKIRRNNVNNNLLSDNLEGANVSSPSSSIVLSTDSSKLLSFIDGLFFRLEGLIIKNNPSNNLTTIKEEESINTSDNISDNSSFLILIQSAIVSAAASLSANFFMSKNNEAQALQTKENQEVNGKQLSGKIKAQYGLPTINNKLVQEMIETSTNKLQEILPLIKNNTTKIVTKGINQLQITTNNMNKSLNNEEDPFQIKILILEAINYFFNEQEKKQHKQLNNNFLTKFSQTEVMIINDEQVSEPWLSWEDLYGSQKYLPSTHSPSQNISLVKDSLEIFEASDIDVIKNDVTTTSKNNIISILETTEANAESASSLTAIISNPINNINQATKEINIEQVKKEEIKTVYTVKEDVIEAQVIEIKYEKHLLEIILEKLDQIILWLEEKIIKLIKIIKILIANVSQNKS